MSDFDANPFGDPEGANPFADPSVQQAARPPAPAGLEEFNPFADQQNRTAAQLNTNGPATMPVRQAPPPQPAVMHAHDAPPPYTATSAQPAISTAELQRRQEELDRKAEELQRKEQDLRRQQQIGGANVRQNNFPPLPDKFCVQPCFYQDFAVDIPIEFQRIVKMVYYLWLFYVCLLFLNLLGALAYFIASVQSGDKNSSGITFGISILYLVLFTPCSFVCWYRPLYKAFRSDSSFNFFVFFFIFFFQFCVTVLQSFGLDGWGTCGWIVSLGEVSHNPAAGAIMIIISIMFTATAVINMIFLIKVHRIYRNTGASFEKAQAEFAQGVMSNRNVQQAAASTATAAAQGAFQGQTDNRY